MKLNFGLCALSIVAMLAASPSAMAASATVGAGVGATVGTGTGTGGVGANGVANGDVSATATTDANANANATVSVDGGVSQLGVNISLAGNTTISVEAFANTLTTEQQVNLKTRCKKVMGSPGSATADVLAFCKHSTM